MKQYTERVFHDGAKLISMTAESNAMAITDVANWMDVTSWRFEKVRNNQSGNRYVYSAIKEFDLIFYCDADEDLTSPLLYGVFERQLTVASDDFTTDFATDDNLDATAHGLLTGDGPLRLSSSGTLPAGLDDETDYWVIKIGANEIRLATSQANALAGTAVALTDNGSGTHSWIGKSGTHGPTGVRPEDQCARLYWALLGSLNDGNTINVDVQEAYIERVQHNPLFKYYVPVAGETNTETVTTLLAPVETEEV